MSRQTFGVNIQKGEIQAEHEQQFLGFKSQNTSSNYIAQFRKDGFTFSKIKPYEDWTDLKREARKIWDIYKVLTPNAKVTRLAVRYINQLELPFDDEGKINFDHYLTTGPQIPTELGSGIREFFTRIVVPFPEEKANAILTQTLESATQEKCLVILDIDVFREIELDFNDEEMWEHFDSLRSIKNRAFFSSITEESRRLFR